LSSRPLVSSWWERLAHHRGERSGFETHEQGYDLQEFYAGILLRHVLLKRQWCYTEGKEVRNGRLESEHSRKRSSSENTELSELERG